MGQLRTTWGVSDHVQTELKKKSQKTLWGRSTQEGKKTGPVHRKQKKKKKNYEDTNGGGGSKACGKAQKQRSGERTICGGSQAELVRAGGFDKVGAGRRTGTGQQRVSMDK